MSDKVENLILEHLKKIQSEQAASRERDVEILGRLAHLETGLAKITRNILLGFTNGTHCIS